MVTHKVLARRNGPDVSVVIPTYNRSSALLDAIESVREQSYDRFELIVVDDGSTDDTMARVRAIGDPRIQYVAQRHAGVAMARNLGVRVASAPLISFLDSDDVWKPEKLEAEMAFLARHRGVTVVFSDAEKHDAGRFTPSFMRETPAFSRHLPRVISGDRRIVGRRTMVLCLLEEDPIITSAITLRRDAFLRSGGFDESWSTFEDWALFLRLARHETFGYIDEPLTEIRVSPDSLHLVQAERGRTAMLRLLIAERRRSADPAVRRAARRGIVRLRTRLAWLYLRDGERTAAARTFLRGFAETGSPGLVARALGVPLSASAKGWIRRRLERQAA